MEEIERIASTIDGYLSKVEGRLLYYLASQCPENARVAEIGSFKGKSTAFIGFAIKNKSGSIYSIDPHDGFKTNPSFIDFQKNISRCGLEKVIKPLVKTSSQAAPEFSENSLDFIFIDGDHSYEAVIEDFDLWFPKLKVGGMIAFHDSFAFGHPGTRKAVHEKLRKSRLIKDVRYLDSITYARKTLKISPLQWLENHYRILIKTLHEKSSSKGKKWPFLLRFFLRKFFWKPKRTKWLKVIS